MNLNLYHLILCFIKKDERTICTRADVRYIKANYFKKIHVDIILHGAPFVPLVYNNESWKLFFFISFVLRLYNLLN